jgi:hypothetical protein
MNLKTSVQRRNNLYRQSHMKSCSVENNEYIKIQGKKGLIVEPIHHHQSSFHN